MIVFESLPTPKRAAGVEVRARRETCRRRDRPRSSARARRPRRSRRAPRVSRSVMCVACTTHQRASTRACVEQPFDRARAAPREHSSTSRVCSAAWMWIGAPRRRQAHDLPPAPPASPRAGCAARRRARSHVAARASRASVVDELRERVGRVHEAPLSRRRRRAAESGVRVEHRQQRERDARSRCAAATMRSASSAGSAYGLPARIVMHVVEFGDARVARLQPSRRRPARRSPRTRRRRCGRGTRTSPAATSRSCRRARRDACPVRPASARWNACECRLGIAGTTGPRASRAVARRHPRSTLDDRAGVVDVDGDVAPPSRPAATRSARSSFMPAARALDDGDQRHRARRRRIDVHAGARSRVAPSTTSVCSGATSSGG